MNDATLAVPVVHATRPRRDRFTALSAALLITTWGAAMPAASAQDAPAGGQAGVLWVYRDAPPEGEPDTRSDAERLFAPFGLMPAGRTNQITVNPARPVDPSDQSKGTCIEYYCELGSPVEWVGAYTLVEGNSWGEKPGVNVPQSLGLNDGAKLALRFKARGEGAATFKIGGVGDGPHASSLRLAREVEGSPVRLTQEFRDYSIGPLAAGELTNLIDPFCVTVTGIDNRGRDFVRIQVDDIRLEALDAPAAAGAMPSRWRDRLLRTCFVAYTPTGFDPTAAPVRRPAAEDIRADLAAVARLLADAGIAKDRIGVITYGCKDGLEQIPPVAAEVGVSVILGVFDPRDETEVANAEALLRRDDLADTVVACCVGNEAITFRRGTIEDIRRAAARLRAARRVPMTTTEIVQAYGDKRLFEFDFALVNAHAIFSDVREPGRAAEWAVARIKDVLSAGPKGYPVLIKEIGWPAGPAPAFTAEQQADYWEAVLADPVATRVNICIFDGLGNVSWKAEPVSIPGQEEVNIGPHWPVLFGPDRQPKPAALKVLRDWKNTRR